MLPANCARQKMSGFKDRQAVCASCVCCSDKFCSDKFPIQAKANEPLELPCMDLREMAMARTKGRLADGNGIDNGHQDEAQHQLPAEEHAWVGGVDASNTSLLAISRVG